MFVLILPNNYSHLDSSFIIMMGTNLFQGILVEQKYARHWLLEKIVFIQFVAVIQAIFSAGKQLQQLNIGEGNNNTLRSNLLKRLILTASSDSIIANAAKMLSSLNIDSADQGDLTKLITASEGQFPEVCQCLFVWKKIIIFLIIFLSLTILIF